MPGLKELRLGGTDTCHQSLVINAAAEGTQDQRSREQSLRREVGMDLLLLNLVA